MFNVIKCMKNDIVLQKWDRKVVYRTLVKNIKSGSEECFNHQYNDTFLRKKVSIYIYISAVKRYRN